MGWQNCIRIQNEQSEVIISTEIGPRILRFGWINKQNFFYLDAGQAGKTGGSDWRIYGGHRLWHAPEAIPRSYSPDNDPVTCRWEREALVLTQAKEVTTGIVKQLEIRLSSSENQLTVLHRLINHSLWSVDLSVWAISALAPGGKAIIPQEPFGEGDAHLLPVRSMAIWSYTQMDDSRWLWGNKYIQAKQDPLYTSEQKIGVLNRQGWCAYCLNGEILIKQFDVNANSTYPDLGSNNEIYINGNFLEVESLGPLECVPPQGMIQHTENWFLTQGTIENTDASIDKVILPAVTFFQQRLRKTKHLKSDRTE
jgi:hypothetical protein